MNPGAALMALGPALFVLCIPSAQADGAAGDGEPVSVQLFVNVVGDAWSSASGDGMRLDIAGIPLMFGSRTGIADAGTGVAVGVESGYHLPISSRLTFEGHTTLSRTSYLDNVLFGPAVLSNEAALRYANGNFKLALEPAMGVSTLDDDIDQKTYAVTGRISKGLLSGWSITAHSTYMQQDFDLAPADDRQTTDGRFGVTYEFSTDSRRSKIDIAYLVRRELDDEGYATFLQGPSVTASFPLRDQFNLGVNYCYGETAIEELVDNAIDQHEENFHRLGVTADWRLDGKATTSVELKAGYDYIRNETGVDSLQEEAHAGTVSMALHF